MATIRVTNSLYIDQPYRTRLVPENPADAVVVFPENPESWRIVHAPQWRPRGAAGVAFDDVDWTGNNPQRIEWRQTLAARDYAIQVGSQILADVDKLGLLEECLETLGVYAQELDELTGEPRRFILEMGVHSYRVVIEALTLNRLQTTPDGKALSAEVDLTLLRVPNAYAQNPIALRG